MTQQVLPFQIEKSINFVENLSCSICYDDLESNTLTTNCNHIYCVNCFKQYIQTNPISNRKVKCPYCRQIIQKVFMNQQYISLFQKRPTFMEPIPQHHHYGNTNTANTANMHFYNMLITVFLFTITNIILVFWSMIVILFYVITLVALLQVVISLSLST